VLAGRHDRPDAARRALANQSIADEAGDLMRAVSSDCGGE